MDKLFELDKIDAMMKELEEIENGIREMEIYPDDDFDRMKKRACVNILVRQSRLSSVA